MKQPNNKKPNINKVNPEIETLARTIYGEGRG